MLTPYYDCGDANWHLITEKTWIIVFSCISCIQLLKEKVKERVDQMHRSNEITYRTRSKIMLCSTILCEGLHFVWQVYGNVIFYNQSEDPQVVQCHNKKNPGLKWIMLMLILFGYFFFVIYLMVMVLVGGLYFRRFALRRNQQSRSNQILRTIPRTQFSEELFGALNEENECIICMTPYSSTDTITKLNCNERHYYHTACIENWIRQGSNQCPMCRQAINEDI